MSYTKANITKRKFDVVIVGAGGSGMRASLELSRAGLNVACLSNGLPHPPHTPWQRKAACPHRWAT